MNYMQRRLLHIFLILVVCSTATTASHARCCIADRGNVDADPMDAVNVVDVTFLVDYLFKGGATPLCADEANVDAIGNIDVADLSYLVDYLFRSGPAPLPCAVLERVYVPNQADTTIYILDAADLTRLDSFPTPIVEPHFVNFNHDLEYYYILGRQVGGDIAKYRTWDNALVEQITVQGSVFPTALVTGPNDDTLYLTDFTLGPGHTHRYDVTGAAFTWLDSTLQAGHQTHDIRISSDGKYVVSAGFSSDDISIINTQTGNLVPLTLDSAMQVFNPISNNYGPYGVLIDHTSTTAFIACSKGVDQIRIVDLVNLQIVDSVLVPVSNTGNPGRNGPTYMTLTHDNDHLFVTNYLDNTVAVIRVSTREVLAYIEFETPKPFGIDISRDGSVVYVSCTNTRPAPGRVYMIDAVTFQKIDSTDVGSEPFGLTVKPY